MSKNFQHILVLSIFLNFAHMLEVTISGYYIFGFQSLETLFANTSSAIYFSSHIPIYLLTSLFILSSINKKFLKLSLILYFWIFISESHHIIRSVLSFSYFPGSLTSLMYVILGVFYICTLINEVKAKRV